MHADRLCLHLSTICPAISILGISYCSLLMPTPLASIQVICPAISILGISYCSLLMQQPVYANSNFTYVIVYREYDSNDIILMFCSLICVYVYEALIWAI